MIRWGTEYFQKKNIDSPRLTIEILISFATKFSRIQLYMNFDKPLNSDELSVMHEVVRRRANHEPLQYIVGKTEFYGYPILVNSSVLIPRPETEILVETLLKENFNEKFTENQLLVADNLIETEEFGTKSKNPVKILDIGTGSGCISLALAKTIKRNVEILAIDVSLSALELAKQNADRLATENVKFEMLNIMETMPEGKYDLIVSNPPYVSVVDFADLEPELKNHEPKISLTDNADGLTFYRRFAEIFPMLLAENGRFYVEIGFGQQVEIQEIFQKNGFITEIKDDFQKIPRVLIGWFTK